MRKYLLGIDPSFLDCGLCLYDPETDKMQLFTGDLLKAVAWIGANARLSEVIAVLENPNLNQTLFGGWGVMKAEILKFRANQGGMGECQAVFGRLAKMAQGVGKCCAAADLLKSLLGEKKVPVVEIRPSDRHRADRPPRNGSQPLAVGLLAMPTKTSAYQFEVITGYKGRSSGHSRDAATLVWGKSLTWAEGMIERQFGAGHADREIKTTNGEKLGVKDGKFYILKKAE